MDTNVISYRLAKIFHVPLFILLTGNDAGAKKLVVRHVYTFNALVTLGDLYTLYINILTSKRMGIIRKTHTSFTTININKQPLYYK